MGVESVLGAVAGPVVSGLMGGGKSKKNSNTQAAQAGGAQSREDASWVQKQNQAAVNEALTQNRVNQTSDFGGLTWTQGPDGKWSQQISVAPEIKPMLTALRGKQAGAIDNLDTSGSFNVNGDYMNALKGQLQPGLDAAREHENARLAAMGLSTGSGDAWANAQDALNRSSNDANQKAVLGGHDAWLADQNNLRQDLGALDATETGWKSNTAMPTFSQAGAPMMDQNVQNQLASAMAADAANRQGDKNSSIAGWANLASKALPAAYNWWNTAGTNNNDTPGYSSTNYGNGISGSIDFPQYSW